MTRGGERTSATSARPPEGLAADEFDPFNVISPQAQDHLSLPPVVGVEVDPGVELPSEAGRLDEGRLDDLLASAGRRCVNDSVLVHGAAWYRAGVASPGGIR